MKNIHKINNNIYITSDEEIKEGVSQWYLDKFLNKPRNSSGSQYGEKQDVIILTTDQDLINDGVQSIHNEFLEWFVNNPSCEYVRIIPKRFGHPYVIVIDSGQTMKQTAVEWLKQTLESYGNCSQLEIDWNEFDALFDQAKAMEKEQIMDAVDAGFHEGGKFIEDIRLNNAEQYYKETYGKDSKPLIESFCYHKGTYTTIKDSNGNEVCGKCRLPIAKEDKQ